MRQAAIAARVVDQVTGCVVPGVTVAITSAPPSLEGRSPANEVTAVDGCFCFADLPDGQYTLSFSLPGVGRRYGPTTQDFEVRRDAQGRIPIEVATVLMPPTAVWGFVQGIPSTSEQAAIAPAPTPLPFARVQVAETGESVYCDAGGRYYLTGVEPGTRTLRFSAPGYRPRAATVAIAKGTVQEIDSIALSLIDLVFPDPSDLGRPPEHWE